MDEQGTRLHEHAHHHDDDEDDDGDDNDHIDHDNDNDDDDVDAEQMQAHKGPGRPRLEPPCGELMPFLQSSSASFSSPPQSSLQS